MLHYREYFLYKIINKNLKDLRFCKKFIEFEYEPDNDFNLKINELVEKLEDFFM